jgi:hypothetical protein
MKGTPKAMKHKQFYSVRTGKNPLTRRIDLPALRKLFGPLYNRFEGEGYFQEYLGYTCVDAGFVAGKEGHDLEGCLLLALRKENLFPVCTKLPDYAEDDLFDIIEFLYEKCSKPTKRDYHNWNNCGWHCSEFDRDAGQAEFRERVNRLLEIYGNGFELSAEGEVLHLADTGLESLLEAELPAADPENVASRIESALKKFRRYRATLDERRDAIRDLADVLEFLRPQLKVVLASKDEGDIFNIANNFGIRHHNANQKHGYDKAIWYSWLFYYYLATIHAVLRMIEKSQTSLAAGSS